MPLCNPREDNMPVYNSNGWDRAMLHITKRRIPGVSKRAQALTYIFYEGNSPRELGCLLPQCKASDVVLDGKVESEYIFRQKQYSTSKRERIPKSPTAHLTTGH